MPTRKKSSRRSTSRSTARKAQSDAISLLKADHRTVEDLFAQFEKARNDERKATLAEQICQALTIHTMIEEEIFYPAFYEATQEKDIHHEAVVEHDGAKKLIAEIQSAGPEDDFFESRVSVLSEMIKHHVKEEEGREGMFAEARNSEMDLDALGEQLATRKQELEASPPPRAKAGKKSGMQMERGAVA